MNKVKLVMPILASVLAIGGTFATTMVKNGFKAPINTVSPCTSTSAVPDICSATSGSITCTIVLSDVTYDLFSTNTCSVKFKRPS